MRIQPKATEFHSVVILFYKLDAIYSGTLFGTNLGIFESQFETLFTFLNLEFFCQRSAAKGERIL